MKRLYCGKAFFFFAIVGLATAWTAVHADGVGSSAIERLDPNMAAPDPKGEWLWYDASRFAVEGKGWLDTASFYHRLPAKAQGVVRDPVWSLSTHSAGISVRFITDANQIAARWTVVNENLAMPHMPATGVSGLDLYANDEGVWRWIGNGRPAGKTTQAVLASGIPQGEREFLLYLPLYNGTESLEIGIPPGAVAAKPGARSPDQAAPVVFYGTSITHGGCAARPGMAYPSILGRRLGWSTINLGFSGNGTMDAEMGALLAELDAAAYVLDCIPNMSHEMIVERIVPFVKVLRAARPQVPIVLMESIYYQAGAFLPEVRQGNLEKNKALLAGFQQLEADNTPLLYYVSGESLMGDDGEATVDGTHPTDLGFLRMAEALEPVLRKVLQK